MQTRGTSSEKHSQDFRVYLQRELARRCGTNPSYSLRSFARSLGASPSFLSHLLKGKRSVTQQTIVKFAERLNLTPEDQRRFLKAHSQSKNDSRRMRVDNAPDLLPLQMDQFQYIAEWYHYAILELPFLKDFDPGTAWISKRLKISAHQVTDALDRLERLGLIEFKRNGKWKNTGNYTTVGTAASTPALRIHQEQILNKAVTALNEVPVAERDNSSLTLALDSRLVPELKEIIRGFRKSVASLQSKSKTTDQVYQVSIAAFPVTQKNKKQRRTTHAS